MKCNDISTHSDYNDKGDFKPHIYPLQFGVNNEEIPDMNNYPRYVDCFPYSHIYMMKLIGINLYFGKTTWFQEAELESLHDFKILDFLMIIFIQVRIKIMSGLNF